LEKKLQTCLSLVFNPKVTRSNPKSSLITGKKKVSWFEPKDWKSKKEKYPIEQANHPNTQQNKATQTQHFSQSSTKRHPA
jgi:hypothetical protein